MNTEEQNATVHISFKDVILEGFLNIPANPKGLVLFSHGSGSGRLSPRNNYVSNILQQKGIATLLFDLLTESEDKIYKNRFDMEKLTHRLIETTQWAQQHQKIKGLPLGYFGASTGAASALRAAAFFGTAIKAVVSRGGRPDLATTLFIVGSRDTDVISMNQRAYEKLKCRKKLEIIPGAGHLFEEPGKLRAVAEISATWFLRWLEKNPENYV